MAATAYDSGTRALKESLDPEYGYSHGKRWGVLLFISWRCADLMPEPQRDKEE
jgi:hypothetical protein